MASRGFFATARFLLHTSSHTSLAHPRPVPCFPTSAYQSRIFQSYIFYHCSLVPHFPALHLWPPAFSGLALAPSSSASGSADKWQPNEGRLFVCAAAATWNSLLDPLKHATVLVETLNPAQSLKHADLSMICFQMRLKTFLFSRQSHAERVRDR